MTRRSTGSCARRSPCSLIGSGSLRLLNAIRVSNRAEHELFTRSQVDELTGLPNRVQLISAIGEVLDDTWRTESRPSLMQVNLDRFKNINDSLGHELANEVLCELGARLRGLARDIGAHIARPSGDEFVILDRDAGSPAHAFARAESIHAALSEPFVVDGVSVFVTSSIGLAVVPKNRTITPEEFLRRADIATHRAKANGRNCIALFDESMQTSVTQRMDMENALYGAVERRELRLYHQPIVEIETGRISGFEALIRWRRDDGTLIAPADFIPIAEDTGLINTIGAWALLEALTELRRWINEGIVEDTTTISVNVSPRQIADPALRRHRPGGTHPLRRATSPAVARGHRVDDVVGTGDRQEHVAASAGDGCAAGARRLRHRLLVAVAAPAVPAPADQDRPGVHPGRRRPRQRSVARAHDRGDGLVDGPRRRRRGCREHPPAPRAARHRLRQGPGLPHQPSDPGRRDALDDGRPVGSRLARVLRSRDSVVGVADGGDAAPDPFARATPVSSPTDSSLGRLTRRLVGGRGGRGATLEPHQRG